MLQRREGLLCLLLLENELRDARLLELVAGDEPRAPLVRRYLRVLRLRSLLDLRAPRPLAALVLLVVYAGAFAAPLFLLPVDVKAIAHALVPTHAAPATDPTERYRKEAAALTLDQLVDGIAADQRDTETAPAAAAVPADADFLQMNGLDHVPALA